jgi:hypothetical protein
MLEYRRHRITILCSLILVLAAGAAGVYASAPEVVYTTGPQGRR